MALKLFDTGSLKPTDTLVRYRSEDGQPIPAGRYFVSTSHVEPALRRALGGIPVSFNGRFEVLYPPLLYVRRALTGLMFPQVGFYGKHAALVNQWPDSVRDLMPRLHPWQREALLDGDACLSGWRVYRRGIIAGLGGGKTLFGLLCAARYPEESAVLAPRYLHSEWVEESKAWGLPLPLLSTFESAHKLPPVKCLICDEAGRVANPETARTEKTAALANGAEIAIAMTGRPMSAAPKQIRWLNVACPGFLPPSDHAFDHAYGLDTKLESVAGREVYVTSRWNLTKLAADCAPLLYTVDTSYLTAHLPPVQSRVRLTPKPKFYEQIKAGAASTSGKAKVVSQCCQASDGSVLDDAGNPMDFDDSKLRIVLDDIIQAGEPVFVVAHWRRTIERFTAMLRGAEVPTAVIGEGDDADAMTRFKTGNARVLLAPYEKTEGLNLQKVCRLTFVISNGTRPEMRKQLVGRTFRHGQTRGCVVIDYCAEGTLDQRRLALLQEHEDRTEAFILAALEAEI